MLKETRIKSTCHPELVSGSIENNALNIAGFRNKFGMTECGEDGRSMVEMLGVLAIIGVLSIGGVYGYTTAMNKHRANELLNEANKRAAIVAIQVAQDREILSIGEFDNNLLLGFNETVTHDISNKTFSFSLRNVKASVCDQMKAMVGVNSMIKIEGTCGDNLVLVFNDDLAQGKSINDNKASLPVDCSANTDACSGCQECDIAKGICVDKQEICSVGTCVNGICLCDDNRLICGNQCCDSESICGKDGCIKPTNVQECIENTGCGLGKYCKIGAYGNVVFYNSECVEISDDDLVPVSYNNKVFYTPKVNMNWVSAQNFCLAHNKKLASLASLGISKDYDEDFSCTKYDDDGNCLEAGPLFSAFKVLGIMDFDFWLVNNYAGSSYFHVEIYDDWEVVEPQVISGMSWPLCE